MDVYSGLRERCAVGRELLGRPMTYAEKVLFAHARSPRPFPRGRDYVDFDPDRVVLQDALAQIVALQFMIAGLDEVVIPTTVHCDHLIRAREGADSDLASAVDVNAEVYDFLRSVCARYGIGFWEPGSGIIHQVVLENYAFPGGMVIGTDSHTPNAGGLGMIAVGVGGGDAIDAMTGSPFNLRWPRLIGVHLTGSLSGWTSPKDVILAVAGELTVSGGTGAIVEYFGPGARTIAATGKATICNMGAELGATTSLFPFDDHIAAYLKATGRGSVAWEAASLSAELQADPEVEADPGRFFDQVLEIDLDRLEPLINGPDSPDRVHRVSEVGRWAAGNGIPVTVSAALLGSCTNSSYEDITKAAAIARVAAASGRKARSPLFVTPGSAQIRATVERDGLLEDLRAIGAVVLANACGPCIGQWDRTGLEPDAVNTIVTSYNRNFPSRNDGSPATKAFVTSPEMVVALALAGTLEFDPRRASIEGLDIDPPVGQALPAGGFTGSSVPTATPRPDVHIAVAEDSERLQLLRPFPAWDGHDFIALPVLLKARGKCTTDHISAAGPWLRYRGHLDRISDNLFLGVTNAFTGARGAGRDPLDGSTRPFPEIAARLSQSGVRWCAVGDENYGEGSSREHAAMEPRHRGGAVIIARSFARIHETNLKKQGVLPLTFADAATYELIAEDDRISVLGLASLGPDQPVRCSIVHADGSELAFECLHSFSADQLEWFRAGSALNVRRLNYGSGGAL